MCSFSFSTNYKDIDALDTNNFFLRKRGPDYTNKIIEKDFCAIHNLLHITGTMTVQPIITKDLYTFFNGELYSYPKKYKCDSLAVPSLYKHVERFHSIVDGEYAIIFFDRLIQKIYFLKDIFGTKPLYYSTEGGKLLLSSLKSGLNGLSSNIKSVLPNTLYCYDIKNKILNVKPDIHVFNTTQHVDNLKSFNAALRRAIRKRIPKQQFCVGLSSGIDSGTLALYTYKHNNSNYISILNNENKNIIQQRYNILKDKLTTYTFDTSSRAATIKTLFSHSEPEKYIDYNYFSDSSSFCLAYIGKYCNMKKIKVFLSGTGADEIFSDYGHNGIKYTDNSCFGGQYPVDLNAIFPWKNFFNGTMQDYLEKDEKILGSFGIETRYPFLDKQLVQEFLWLTPSIKNYSYKYCLVNNLIKMRFPHWTEKKGFSCEKV